jgi:GNAT superfamily N-acetyltransferase
MLAVPVTASTPINSGPRPINLSKDVRPVLELLRTAFGPLRDSQGRVISDRFSITQSASFARRLSMISRGFVPGFVWEESGQIVGNVTLLDSPIDGRYLVANVAVHPDFRRRGIARALMDEVLARVESWNGHQIYLQVESENQAALDLYDSLAFERRGEVRRWFASLSSLRLPPDEDRPGFRPRRLRGREWRAARELDRTSFHPDLNWPAPPPPDYYRSGWWRGAADLLNGRRQETWVIDQASERELSLVGLVDIVSEWTQPHHLRLCIAPEWQGRLDRVLLRKAVKRLLRFHDGTINFNYPAAAPETEELFKACNFELQRSLTVMRKNLRQIRTTDS